jgi:RimJ/RimL family protein N-acetyltransferase
MESVAPLQLTTSRLVLRDFVPTDAAALHVIEGNPQVTRYTSYDPQTPEETIAQLAQRQAEQAARPRVVYDLAILLAPDARMIGRCGFGVQRPEHREAMLWYVLDPSYWGRGYTVEATRAVVDFAFNVLKLHRLFADCDPRNHASCRVAQKLGMTHEGRLRENYFLKGEWCSSEIYAVLEHEWRG